MLDARYWILDSGKNKKILSPLNKSFFRHSGLPSSAVAMLRRVDDPESRKSLKSLDPPVKPGDDAVTTFVTFFKGLILIIAILSCPSISLSQAKTQSKDIETSFLVPKPLTICGEPMPLDAPWVLEMLDRAFTITVWDKA